MLLACSAADALRLEDGRPAMGTVLEVTIEAGDAAAARAAADACFAEADRLEAILSRWREDSDVSRLNAGAGGEALAVHADLLRLLGDAKRFSAETAGSFDVTVGPLVALWTRAGTSGALPTTGDLETARSRVGPDGIELVPPRARLARAGMTIDLGGIAKGWALDRMEDLLRARGIERALISFGQSSLLGLGTPEGDEGWRVLVRDPRGDSAGVVLLRDQRLSISGSFGSSSVIEGRRFGHVLDPRTGWPVSHAALAVVLAPTAARAEAWSKALLVLSPDEALAAIESASGLEGLWIGEARPPRTTSGFGDATRFEWLPTRTP